MNKIAARHPAVIHRFLNSTNNAKPLNPEQDGAGNSRNNDQAERGEDANLAADDDESRDFSERNGEKQEGDDGKAHEPVSLVACFSRF